MAEPVIDRGLPAIDRLQPVLDVEHFRCAQRIKRQRRDLRLGGFEPVEGGRDGLSIRWDARIHISNTSSNHRRERTCPQLKHLSTAETGVVQVISSDGSDAMSCLRVRKLG